MLESLSAAIQSQWIIDMVNEHSFLWPVCEFLHFVGLTALVGTVGMYDLRLLGVAKQVPLGPLQRLIPIGIAGFAVCLMTGYVFVVGDAFKAPLVSFRNISFQLKMLFILLAGVNVLIFYTTGLGKKCEALGAGDDAPRAAKIIAGTSLALWIGVMYFGRMLPWQDAFYVMFGDY